MLTTQITQNYNFPIPIIAAGMAFVATPELAAAVSNAGGMGTFSAFMKAPEAMQAMIRQTRSLTEQPFGIDFITEFANDDHIDVCIAEHVPVVIFFWSFPPQAWVTRLQANGVKVWMEIGALAEANQARAMGFDAIIAQGKESGGHNRAEASTFNLLPAICQAVAPIPVIAAGGIIDGKSLVAALALGAEAVWCGTRFLASQEAHAHADYKARVLSTSVGETIRTDLFGPEWPGQPLRVIKNRVVRQWSNGSPPAAAQDGTHNDAADAGTIIGSTIINGEAVPMPKFSAMLPTPETSGDLEEMCLTAGESCGNIQQIKSAGEIVIAMANEALEIIQGRLGGLVQNQDQPSQMLSTALGK